MRGHQLNDYPIYFAKQLAIPGIRLTVGLGLSELSHSDQIPQRHNPISTVVAEKGPYAS
jgi:hypothetical protein